MLVDISFILSFPAAKRADVIASLGDLCVNAPGDRFDPSLIAEDCSVRLLIAAEELRDPVEGSRQRGPGGLAPVGHVQLWIATAGDRVTFELWPTTSAVGERCLRSPSLRRSLVALVAQHGGDTLTLDRSDGTIETLYRR